ncbi:MAG: hypothetical protein M1828_007199 [Chrysothrix sp. TS-e1954]|nr:MAG: hypothetical protein M1828_007199 [Chrysothrix sp. TS-e1954]
MPGTPRPRKRVDWYLPDDSPQHSPTGSIAKSSPFKDPEDSDSREQQPQHDLSHQNAASERTALSTQPTETTTEEELRRDVHRIFAQMPSSSRSSSAPELSHLQKKPKGVLRISGHNTPNLPASPPPEDLNEGIEDHEGKSKSATSAQQRADQLSRSLGEEGETSRRAGFRIRSRKQQKGKQRATPGINEDIEKQQDLSDLYYPGEALYSGQVTPIEDPLDDVPRPKRYMTSGLSALTMLNRLREAGRHSRSPSFDNDPRSVPASGASSPTTSSRLSISSRRSSASSIGDLLSAASARLSPSGLDGPPRQHGSASRKDTNLGILQGAKRTKYKLPRSPSSGDIKDAFKKMARLRPNRGTDVEIKIRKHIRAVKIRHRYMIKLCRALMVFGAPTHRMEEYMILSARTLEIEAQFLYLPGCMIMSFDDSKTHTTNVKMVRCQQGVDLGRLRDAHEVYKEVVHDLIGVEEAVERLDELLRANDKFPTWVMIAAYGAASATVGPWAFEARPVDLGPIFLLGGILGFIRLKVVSAGGLYADVFEIVVTAISTFVARWLGSIWGGDLFCFSSIAQSSIVLILPGYLVLMGSLELQARCIIAGSVRLIYATIISLFLGFGLTIGSALYGLIDEDATSSSTCQGPLPDDLGFIFVPFFTFSLLILNQAKWRQMPAMMIISYVGWMVNRYASDEFPAQPEVGAAVGAFAVSLMANLWSRLGLKVERACRWLYRPFASHFLKLRQGTFKLFFRQAQSKKPDDVEKQTPAQLDGAGSHILDAGIMRSGTAGPHGELPSDRRRRRRHPLPKVARSVHINYSLAAASMLPAILVQVPSGLAVGGSLISGVMSADAITRAGINETSSAASLGGNYTSQGLAIPGSGSTDGSNEAAASAGGSLPLEVALAVIQVAIGITVGLFLGSLVVYPFGKGGGRWGGARRMRSGLFSF